jgi:hypothetical protein
MSDYERPHATFDEHEIPVSIHCIRCHIVIGRRAETPTADNPAVAVHSLLRAPNYREVYTQLSDGSVMYMPFCDQCVKDPIDAEKGLDCVKRTWREGLIHLGRPQEALDDLDARTANLTVTKVGGISNARNI